MYRIHHDAARQDDRAIPNVYNNIEVANAVYKNFQSQETMDTAYENFPPREHAHDVYENPNRDESCTYSTIDDIQQGH